MLSGLLLVLHGCSTVPWLPPIPPLVYERWDAWLGRTHPVGEDALLGTWDRQIVLSDTVELNVLEVDGDGAYTWRSKVDGSLDGGFEQGSWSLLDGELLVANAACEDFGEYDVEFRDDLLVLWSVVDPCADRAWQLEGSWRAVE